MRLINVHTLELEEFWGGVPPAYAILSHTWGDEEVSFQEWKDRASVSHKAGYRKIVKAALIAASCGLNYVWVDTNCIDKTSSSELSEAINSMFAWYAEAEWCFVYFDDVASTLQELIAPEAEKEIAEDVSHITGIDQKALFISEDYTNRSIAARMHWASRRRTTRVEDMAYCLLRLFNINMPLLYGEGRTAFQRLQEEIMKVSVDQSIFACVFTNKFIIQTKTSSRAPIDTVYSLTNFGLSIQLPLLSDYPVTLRMENVPPSQQLHFSRLDSLDLDPGCWPL
ncbi:heterokaryon incompatibility protein-domain-containing protein [Xylaria castorea]|nr:heterokaryon incompatibility protein-domain-containing protein [Xylaria castorea]